MPRIEKLYAYVVADNGPEDEGVMALHGPMGWMPMVGADVARHESLKAHAQATADQEGKEVVLVEFSVRREVQVFRPRRDS